MNFRRGREREEPEINFIPLIDVLLVILIFLLVSTSYSQLAGLNINLPTAKGSAPSQNLHEIMIAVTANNQIKLGNISLAATDKAALVQALKPLASANQDSIVLVNADAKANYQAVVTVMEAAREAGLAQLSFITQNPAKP